MAQSRAVDEETGEISMTAMVVMPDASDLQRYQTDEALIALSEQILEAGIRELETRPEFEAMHGRYDQAKAVTEYILKTAYDHQVKLRAKNNVTHLVILIEHELGEVMKLRPKNKGESGQFVGGQVTRPPAPPTLAQMQITKFESALWQKVAKIPIDVLEDMIATFKENDMELSSFGLLAFYKKLQEEQAEEADAPLVTDFQVSVADIRDGLPVEADSIDLILTDPPYPKEYLPLYRNLASEAARILKPGGSLAVMCGQSYLPEIFQLMASKTLIYRWTLTYLTPGGQSAQLWDRQINTFWKPILWFVKGDYEGDWKGDVTKSKPNDNDKRFHVWGQSESGMADLVERFSKAGDLICDPFVGGGTTGVAAIVRKRQFIGFDKDAACVALTQQRMAQCVTEMA